MVSGVKLVWCFIGVCRELFRKEFISEAMTSVKRGYDSKGYMADPELAAYVIEQLARAGLKVSQHPTRRVVPHPPASGT